MSSAAMESKSDDGEDGGINFEGTPDNWRNVFGSNNRDSDVIILFKAILI